MKRMAGARVKLEEKTLKIQEDKVVQNLLGTELAKKWHIANAKLLEELKQSKLRLRELEEENLDLIHSRTDLIIQLKKAIPAAPTEYLPSMVAHSIPHHLPVSSPEITNEMPRRTLTVGNPIDEVMDDIDEELADMHQSFTTGA